MRQNRTLLAAVITTICVTLFATADYAQAETPREELVEKLNQLNAWLGEGTNGDGWRKYLQWKSLQAQLKPGNRPDPAVLAETLQKLSAEENGLDLKRFVAARQALSAYVAFLKEAEQADLAKLANEVASAKFTAPPETALANARGSLEDALRRFDRYLARQPYGDDWRAYLHLAALERQLDSSRPNPKELSKVLDQFTSGASGLELEPFARVRQELEDYLGLAQIAYDQAAPNAYQQYLDALSQQLPKYAKQPTQELAASIGQKLHWLRRAQEAGKLVEAAHMQYRRPNLYVQVSSNFVAAAGKQAVDETAPVTDVILGTNIYGTGRTQAEVSFETFDDPDRWVVDLFMRGSTATRSTGYNGPAIIYSTGDTRFVARKRILVGPKGFRLLPARTSATTDSTTTGVSTRLGFPFRSFITTIARQKVAKSESQAEYIAARHAEDRISRKVDARLEEKIAKVNQKYRAAFYLPLTRRGAFPQAINFTSGTDVLKLVGLGATPDQLGASTAPPKVNGEVDLAVRLHDSIGNNFGAHFAGATVHEDDFKAKIVEILGYLPERLNKENPKKGIITFAKDTPFTFHFDDGKVTIILRTDEIERGEKYGALDVTVNYHIQKVDGREQLVRDDEIQVLPRGFVVGKDRLSTSRQLKLRLVRRFFEDVFREKYDLRRQFTGEYERIGSIEPMTVQSKDGWLTLTWKQRPPTRLVQTPQD